MSVELIVECKNEKTAEKLMDKLEGKKGVLGVALSIGKNKEDSEPVELKMPKPAELKVVLTEVKEVLGAEVLVDIYTTHDATKLKDLDKEEWPTVFAEANQLLTAHAEKEAGKKDKKVKKGEKNKDAPKKKGKSKDEVKTSLDDVKKLCTKVAAKTDLDRQREILSEFGMNTTRGLNKAEQPVLNSIAAAMRKELGE